MHKNISDNLTMNLASIPLIMTLLSADPGGSLSDAAPGDTVVGQIPEALTLPQAPRRMVRITDRPDICVCAGVVVSVVYFGA